MNRIFLLVGLFLLVANTAAGCAPEISTPTNSPLPNATSSAEPLIPTAMFIPTSLPAFPGAEGFGADTPGGRGGRVIEVTSLQDSGQGSLRSAIEAEGPRIVVFRVAGIIELQSTLKISNPYITIAGQTAPGGGITLRDISINVDPLLDIQTHDVVVRYLTFRAGPPAAGDAVNISVSTQTWDHNVHHIIVDHNSMSWGVDQVFATWYDVHDLSIQWNIFSEGLNCSIHLELEIYLFIII
jgi:pectate lyase